MYVLGQSFCALVVIGLRTDLVSWCVSTVNHLPMAKASAESDGFIEMRKQVLWCKLSSFCTFIWHHTISGEICACFVSFVPLLCLHPIAFNPQKSVWHQSVDISGSFCIPQNLTGVSTYCSSKKMCCVYEALLRELK